MRKKSISSVVAGKGWALSESFLKVAAEDIPDALVVADDRAVIRFANRAALDLLGYSAESLAGKEMAFLVSDKFSFKKDDFVHGDVPAWQGLWRAASGADIEVYCSCTALRDNKGKIKELLFIAKDISSIKQSEDALMVAYKKLKVAREQLVQSEKMAIVGRLAGGIAHELRNPLAIIMQAVYLISHSRGLGDKAAGESLDLIKDAVRRADNIIAGLLEYSRNQGFTVEAQAIKDLLEESLALYSTQLVNRHIRVESRVEPADLVLDCDRSAVVQMFVNLLQNSLEAIGDDGIITVDIKAHGGQCVISFCDNGPGIPEGDLSKIFEPFFTTKLATKNPGLGLALVELIVGRHQGSVKAGNVPGRGAEFTIKVPLGLKRKQ